MRKASMSTANFRLLVSFLNDPDESTVQIATRQLQQAARKRPALARAVEKIEDTALRAKAREVLETAQWEELEPEFRRLFRQGANLDLEHGLSLLARVAYPQVRPTSVSRALDGIAEGVSRNITKRDPLPTRAISAMRHHLFEELGFRGNAANYFDPDNSFINRVLEQRMGIPISLSCVYLLVGWRLGMTVHGIGLPGHYLVGHRTPRGVTLIDPYNRGRVLRKKNAEVLVKRLGIPFEERFLDPLANVQTLWRTIVNLINIYTDQGALTRARRLASLFPMPE